MSDVIAPVTVKPKPLNAPAGFAPDDALAPGQRRPDQVGEPLQDVDADGALAAHPIADGAVERLRRVLVDRDRGAAARRQPLQFVEPLVLRAVVLEHPELRREAARRGLEQRRQIEMIGAEAHAVFAQHRARRLVEAFDVLGDLLPLQHADRLDQLEGDAAGDAGDVLGRGEREQRRRAAARCGS